MEAVNHYKQYHHQALTQTNTMGPPSKHDSTKLYENQQQSNIKHHKNQ